MVDFFATNQPTIYHSAALLYEYIKPGIGLENVNKSGPWAGSTSWKEFCRRSLRLHKIWEGMGHAVAGVLTPPGSNDHHIKVDEKAGICITTRFWGGLTVTHLYSGVVLWCLPMSRVRVRSRCEYDNGYLVFDNNAGDREKEVWRLASDLSAEGEVAAYSQPDNQQTIVSARAAEVYHHYAPRGHFRPWALLRTHEATYSYRLAYPTLISAGSEHAFLHDVCTGSLEQTINISVQERVLGVDVNERHAFVCEADVVHVFSRESGSEILRIPRGAIAGCSLHVEDPALVSGDWFITPLSVSPEVDEYHHSKFIAAQVSKDGGDLVVLSENRCVLFIRDFERICRGETTLERACLVLGFQPEEPSYLGFKQKSYLDFKHGRVCVATFRGLYIFIFGCDLTAKAAFVRPSKDPLATSDPIKCTQLTDRRIYFTWADARRREDIPLIEDAGNAQELPPPPTIPTFDLDFEVPPWTGLHMGGSFECNSVGYIDFSL